MNVGHHRRLGHRRGAVVHRCVGDVETSQLGDQGLELVDRLQGALARLGLVGRVGAVELGLGRHRRHGRRNEAAVHAAPAEGQAVREDAIAGGKGLDLRHRFELGEAGRFCSGCSPVSVG